MLASLAISLCQIGCTSKKEEKEEKEKFTATSPVQMDTTIRKDFVSQIRSFRNIELRAQEKGYLEQIFVDEGQFVHKGQLLFRIMPKMYEAEYRKSSAEVNVAEIEVQNTKTLADKNVVSPNELAMAKAKLEQAKPSIKTWRKRQGGDELSVETGFNYSTESDIRNAGP